jgi:hypothetical protein
MVIINQSVGPGDYNVPKLIGSFKLCSFYSNAPSYTMAKKSNTKKLFITKRHCKILRDDIPGAGLYSPNFNSYLRTNPKYSITRTRRFDHSPDFLTKSYDTIDLTSCSKKTIAGGSFTRTKRFWRPKFFDTSLSPGPADYLTHNRNYHSGVSFTHEKRLLDKRVIIAPGPSSYTPKLYTKKSPIVLPKV